MIEKKLPNGIVPYAHQVDAAEHIFHQHSALNALDVGVGKTLTSILVARAYKELTGGDVVVVAPASLLENWRRETKGLVDIKLFSASASQIPKPAELGDERFYLIADEAHYYQNIYSTRTRAMIELTAAADGFLPMTATPIRNYPSNLFPLLKMIGHPLGLDYRGFLTDYCDGRINGSSNLRQLHSQIQSKLILGSRGDFLDLPPFTRIMQEVVFSGAAKIIFELAMQEQRDEYRDRLDKGIISKGGWVIVLLNHLRQAAALGKSMSAVKLANGYLATGHQVAIFTNYNASARYIDKWLDGHGSELLNGSVPKGSRHLLVDRFQEGDSKVFVMTRAGSAGLNLQKGTVFISNDRTWSPFDMIQAEGRIYRNGQEFPCRSIWLQDKVIDPYLDRMMLRKYRVARMAIAGTLDNMDGVGDPGEWADSLRTFIFGYK